MLVDVDHLSISIINISLISFISLISVLGIVIGVWALITVLSVMNGFERELRERILTVASHLTVTGRDGHLKEWPRLAERLGEVTEVTGSAPYILSQVMLANGNATTGALIRGIAPHQERSVSWMRWVGNMFHYSTPSNSIEKSI